MPGSHLFCRWFLVLSIGLIVMATTGCADPKKPYPVKGTILFEDDQPARELANYLVTFESPELHASAVGLVGEDGTFHLRTLKENDGAIPGPYRVTLTPPLPPEIQADRRRPRTKVVKDVIDPRYENSDTTDLAATVAPQSNDITLRVKRVKKK
jgi:hypothetical protein